MDFSDNQNLFLRILGQPILQDMNEQVKTSLAIFSFIRWGLDL